MTTYAENLVSTWTSVAPIVVEAADLAAVPRNSRADQCAIAQVVAKDTELTTEAGAPNRYNTRSQKPALIPQGPPQRIFDITYHTRDDRRRVFRETYLLRVAPSEPIANPTTGEDASPLPPLPGRNLQWQPLGTLKDYTRE